MNCPYKSKSKQRKLVDGAECPTWERGEDKQLLRAWISLPLKALSRSAPLSGRRKAAMTHAIHALPLSCLPPPQWLNFTDSN